MTVLNGVHFSLLICTLYAYGAYTSNGFWMDLIELSKQRIEWGSSASQTHSKKCWKKIRLMKLLNYHILFMPNNYIVYLNRMTAETNFILHIRKKSSVFFCSSNFRKVCVCAVRMLFFIRLTRLQFTYLNRRMFCFFSLMPTFRNFINWLWCIVCVLQPNLSN